MYIYTYIYVYIHIYIHIDTYMYLFEEYIGRTSSSVLPNTYIHRDIRTHIAILHSFSATN